MGKLTTLDVARVTKPGMLGDGDGLYLQVGPGGARSWVYRFMLAGKERYLGLGSANAIPLKRARELAAEARQLRAEGIDPIERRRSERLAVKIASAKVTTFAQAATQYIAAHEVSWKNQKHAAQWTSTLKLYVYPLFGDLPVQEINTGLIMQVLVPIWTSKPETASRVRGRIETILDWATVRQLRQGDNPARWRGHIEHLLPAKAKLREPRHFTAMPYSEVPAFMVDLRGRQRVSARCLEFTILTAARTSEAIGARWDEFNLHPGRAVRMIPSNRMKAGVEHRVPLAPRVVELLRELEDRRESEFVFAGMRRGQPISNMSMLKQIAVMGQQVTTHGFRSAFTDWAHETTDFPAIVIDMALAHVVSDKVQAAYRRGDLFDKRRKLMEAWADYCAGDARIP
jgi:integrase